MDKIALLCASILPLLLLVGGMNVLIRGGDVLGSLKTGGEQGIKTVLGLLPTLCGLLCAVYMLRASGMFETLSLLLSPVLEFLKIPPELTPLIIIRPLSGSGALATGAEIMKNAGPDSLAGRMAAVMLASSETTLYTASVYFAASGVTKTRYALAAAVCAEMVAFIVSVLTVRLFWG